MGAKAVDIQDAQGRLREIIALVDSGTDVVLTEGERELARIVPIAPPQTTRVAGLHPGAISTTDDFDEPLPEQFWTGPE